MEEYIRVDDLIRAVSWEHDSEMWELSDSDLDFLMDNATKIPFDALDKQNPKSVVAEGDDESDFVRCPRCDEILGVNESVYDSFYDNKWQPVYCHRCGQALVWKE